MIVDIQRIKDDAVGCYGRKSASRSNSYDGKKIAHKNVTIPTKNSLLQMINIRYIALNIHRLHGWFRFNIVHSAGLCWRA